MPVKKSELYGSIWAACDHLRGGMDASQYKDYVLVLLFVKYVTDRYAGRLGGDILVPPGGSYADLLALRGTKEIGDGFNKVIGRLAEANGLQGVLDEADFASAERLGSGKDLVDRLSGLVSVFDRPELNFKGNAAEGDDLLGDAYEYLLRHFATQSGKSKGQFYTPAEVSRVMAKVVGLGGATGGTQTIYDPTCGSGSLLVRAHAEALAATGFDLAVYGQEKDNATYGLARMNTILHQCPTAEVARGNTLAAPHWNAGGTLKTFDFAVANPPFSDKQWLSGMTPAADPFGRFTHGVPPAKNGDYAFLLHLLASLKSRGKGAIVLPHGVLFRGNAEASIRRNLLRSGVIKGVIGLPANLFFGTGIPACLVVIDKEGAGQRTGVFLLDASKGFRKDGNKNRLREQDLHKIVDVFTTQRDVPGYARLVPLAEIADPRHDYNLNLPRYLDGSAPEDIQDLDAHLNGGLPGRDLDRLADYWKVLPGVRAALVKPGPRPGYFALTVAPADVRRTIFEHPEFRAFTDTVTAIYAKWKRKHGPMLAALKVKDKPKPLLHALAESLLEAFRAAPLLDPYDIYQHFTDLCAATLQDDAAMVCEAGWAGAARLRVMVAEEKAKPDLVVGRVKYRAELLPPALLVARYFATERAAADALEAARAAAEARLDEFREENAGEDGPLAEAADDAGKVSEAAAKARLREVRSGDGFADERAALTEYLRRLDDEKRAAKAAKEAEAALAAAVVARYAALTDAEACELVVGCKWLAAVEAGVRGELDRVSQALAGRVTQLAERYAAPLPRLSADASALAAKVAGHLTRLGVTWTP